MADRRILLLAGGVAGLALAGVVVLRMMPAPVPVAPAPPEPVPAAPAIALFPDAPPEALFPEAAPAAEAAEDGGTVLIEALWDEVEARLRLRFLRPDLATVEDLSALEPEMAALCEGVGLPLIAAEGWQAREIVVSIADRPLPVGVFDPEVLQIFEAYRPEDATCIWEEF